MTGDVKEAIAALMKRFRVSTDQSQADRLRVGPSTVTRWRRRGAVPERYMPLLSDRPTSLPDMLEPNHGPAERKVIVRARVRLVIAWGPKMTNYSGHLQHGGYLAAQLALGLERAFLDMTA